MLLPLADVGPEPDGVSALWLVVCVAVVVAVAVATLVVVLIRRNR